MSTADRLSAQLAAHRSDADLKAKTVAALRREVEAAERAHADRTAEHERVTAAVDEAAKAFDDAPTEANAVKLSTVQFRIPKSAAAVAAASTSLESARASLEVSARSLDESTQAAGHMEKCIALTLAASAFDEKAQANAPRVIDLVDELRGLLADNVTAFRASAAASSELSTLTGEPPVLRELPFAAAVLGLLRARGVAVHERDAAALLPGDVHAVIGPVVSVVSRALGQKQTQLDTGVLASPGQLQDVDALIAALHSANTLAEARHAIVVANMGPRRPVDQGQSVLSMRVRGSAAEMGRPGR